MTRLARRISLFVAVAVLLLFSPYGSERSVAQPPRVIFRGVVKRIERQVGLAPGPVFAERTVQIDVESIAGPRRSATLYLREEDGRLFGYGDAVEVEITHLGRKVE